jgi:transcriptional regulator with XRE-family HTH domain
MDGQTTAETSQNRLHGNRLVPNKLRAWRLDAGLSLEEAADLIGISPSMLSLLERGLRGASRDTKVRIARRLEVRISDVFEPEPLDKASG